MNKKLTYTFLALAITIVAAYAAVKNFPEPGFGYTGENPNSTCANAGCHIGNGVNDDGSVTVAGLPTDGGYVPDSTYSFSLTIHSNHPDLHRWGFAMIAKNAAGKKVVGTFFEDNETTKIAERRDMNNNVIEQQLNHSAPLFITDAATTYTYDNLKWKAPGKNEPSNNPIKFFFAAVAANGNGTEKGDYVYTSNTQLVLPISLSKVSTAVNGETVSLTWQTSSENNSSYFIIQKNVDNRNFVTIGTVDAAGTSSDLRSYSYTDNKPAYFDKATFYRLILVDKDGSKKYSGIVSVTIKAKGSFVRKIYPNPVVAGSNMQVELVATKDQSVSIELINLKGSKVKQMQSQIAKGNNLVNLQIFKYSPSGMYTLVVRMQDVTQQIPVFIQ